MAKDLAKRVCGSCLFYSWWTGDCCEGGTFRETYIDRKACTHYQRDDTGDHGDYSPDDENDEK